MKKLIIAAAIVCAAVFANAASVGWSSAGLTAYKNDAYYMFVIGQNGADSVATVTALLDQGKDVSSYSIGGGAINNSGAGSQAATVAGAPTLGVGTYTAFMVLFDSTAPKAGESKYAVLNANGDIAGFTNKEVGASTATLTFTAGNVASKVGEFKSFGAVPEPTSAMFLLLGVAGLALKRRRV